MRPTGSGIYDVATFTSTYNSTLSSQQAIYVGGATYTNFYNTLVAAGQSTTTAASNATEYCMRLAMRDALLAAHTAANSSSQWITLTSYGTGANPKIAPGGTIKFGIELYSPGWKILGVDCGNAYCAGLYTQIPSKGNGMWVENCTFDSNRGMPIGATGSTFPVSGNDWYCSMGAHIAGVYYCMFRNNTCTNNNNPFGVRGGNYCVVDGPQASNNDINSGYMDFDTYSLMNGGHITSLGAVGYSAGVAGMLISNTDYVMFYGVEIDHVTNPLNNVDGVAIDLEAKCNHTSVFNCNLHDNYDAAFFFNGTSTNVGTMAVGNVYNNNGLKSPTGTAQIVKSYPTPSDAVIIVGATITLATPTQQLFSLLTWGGLTNATPTGWTYSP